MKFQPKRFVVEVKRGTSRAAFASPDASTDRFSNAEAALFGVAGRSVPKPDPFGAPQRAGQRAGQRDAQPGASSGRILRSLVEPPPPVVEDPDPPVRRGRKPGSKNKTKPQVLVDAAAQDAPTPAAERPRRGRKPGSKNKPKPQAPTAFPASGVSEGGQGGMLAAMRSYGFADDGTVWTSVEGSARPAPSQPAAPMAAVAASVAPVASTGAAERREAGGGDGSQRPRLRLRDRSSILKRYVLDIEPRPGQPGAMRARRLARSS